MSKSIVYAVGTALICSALTTSFYDVAFRVIVEKVYAFFGIAQPNEPMPTISPRPASPDSVITNPNPPTK
jgi:hypothetical protein